MRYLQTAQPNPQLEGEDCDFASPPMFSHLFPAADVSAATSMTLEDIHATLIHLNMISILDNPQVLKPLPGQTVKFPKGRKNGIARKHLTRTITQDEEKTKGPFVPPTRYKVRWDADQVDEYLTRWEAKGYLKLRPEKLKWSPFILSRAHKTQSSEAEGEAGKDDAEIPPSENNGITMEDGVEINKTRSLAFALFDDDNVEVVRASAPREPVPSEITDADHSRVWSPSAEHIERTRPKRNRTRDVDDTPSVRRLRSRDSVVESTPVGRRPRTPRGEASSRSERRKNPTRSRLDISSTPGSHPNLNGNSPVPPSLDDDAAYAAQLAKELDNPHRQLRTRRPSTDQSTHTPTNDSTLRSSSPRKRRRVDSSPEIESTPVPRTSSTRRTSRRVVDTLVPHLKPTITTPSQKSQKMTNGRSTRTPRTRPSRSAIVALRQEEEEEEDEQLPTNGAYATESPLLNGYAATDQGMDDARYDDADTPVTGVTAASRHSVPSDDTMIGGEPTGLKSSTPFGLVPSPALDALSVLAQVAVEDAHKYIVDFGSIASAPAVQTVPDEDAEGEEDEDAEGEPDDDVNM